MKKSILFLILIVISLSVFAITRYSSTTIPDGENDWELPMEDDLVYFRFDSLNFKNKKKDLSSYYAEGSGDVNSKISSELSKKGNKFFSNTNYTMYFGPITISSASSSYTMGKDGKGVWSDTLDGTITIQTLTNNKTNLEIFGDKSSNFTVTGKIRAIFTKNSLSLRIRGFTVMNMAYNYKKGAVIREEAPIEDSYKLFKEADKKDKSLQKFYVELKELLGSFKTILVEQLEKTIKVNEMD